MENTTFKWADDMNCAVTVCDRSGVIVYMNRKSQETFCKDGQSMIGRSMIPCHNAHSQQKMHDMLEQGTSNSYTIQKNGVKKMIYQTPWRENGIVMGLVEISMVIPEEMPHYVR